MNFLIKYLQVTCLLLSEQRQELLPLASCRIAQGKYGCKGVDLLVSQITLLAVSFHAEGTQVIELFKVGNGIWHQPSFQMAPSHPEIPKNVHKGQVMGLSDLLPHLLCGRLQQVHCYSHKCIHASLKSHQC